MLSDRYIADRFLPDKVWGGGEGGGMQGCGSKGDAGKEPEDSLPHAHTSLRCQSGGRGTLPCPHTSRHCRPLIWWTRPSPPLLPLPSLQAIDLVDEAAAKLKMEITSKPEALDVIDRQVCVGLSWCGGYKMWNIRCVSNLL